MIKQQTATIAVNIFSKKKEKEGKNPGPTQSKIIKKQEGKSDGDDITYLNSNYSVLFSHQQGKKNCIKCHNHPTLCSHTFEYMEFSISLCQNIYIYMYVCFGCWDIH